MRSAPLQTQSGRFSPLRYPGGKGKLANFIADIVRINNLSDGTYIEPYAGGAAVAWELLLTGVVRRVVINDLNKPVFEFWQSVLTRTEQLIQLIESTPVTIESRERAKTIFMDRSSQGLELGFATFFLNRTNRSGILNGGAIGGKAQTGKWKIDARFNKVELCERIRAISSVKKRVTLHNSDAVELLKSESKSWGPKALIYLDPPYYDKGRELYYNFYQHGDHADVAFATHNLQNVHWIVSYDDVGPILDLYRDAPLLRYSIGYSARERGRGTEAMFFSPGLSVPQVQGSMIELSRSDEIRSPEPDAYAL
ncbi:DNA adenine methylase [Bosea vestrisii]|uniref:DNA adenine methylase n=1 Tax=Bosea vestrisii TaxID=151416 RepID=UPI0024DF4B0C|nr:DNA adenine methylase [Bosea vestrisii]WID98191.1 DNA adenine methylase [Bosea vestrisii]